MSPKLAWPWKGLPEVTTILDLKGRWGWQRDMHSGDRDTLQTPAAEGELALGTWKQFSVPRTQHLRRAHGLEGRPSGPVPLELLSLALEGLAPRSSISSDPPPAQASDSSGFRLPSLGSSSPRQSPSGGRPPACFPALRLLGSTDREEALWDHLP